MGHTKTKVKGVLAQLVERFNGIEEVSGSNPLCSTRFHVPQVIDIQYLRYVCF